MQKMQILQSKVRMLFARIFVFTRAQENRRPTVHEMVNLSILLLFYCLRVILGFGRFNVS